MRALLTVPGALALTIAAELVQTEHQPAPRLCGIVSQGADVRLVDQPVLPDIASGIGMAALLDGVTVGSQITEPS